MSIPEHEANVGGAGDLTTNTDDREVLCRIIVESSRLNVQQSEFETARTSSEASSDLHRDGASTAEADLPGVEQREIAQRDPSSRVTRIASHVSKGECARVLEEKVPSLWKEQTESGQVDLLLIDFNL